MIKIIFTIIFCVALIGKIEANDISISTIFKGDGLLITLGSKHPHDIIMSNWYIAGVDSGIMNEHLVSSGFRNSRPYCKPNAITPNQLSRIVWAYLNKNHHRLHHSSGELIRQALMRSFPCKRHSRWKQNF